MSGQQLELAIGALQTTPVPVWDSFPMEARARVVTALAALVARIVERERDE
jgi:hypothetical protein